MPYTPPGQSPVITAPSSQRTSYMPDNYHPQSPPMCITPSSPISMLVQSGNPPKSATYLYRQRRSGSISGPIMPTKQPEPPRSNGLHVEQAVPQRVRSPSLQQSPSPVTDSSTLIPTGALLSPPESPVGSDDESAEARRNARMEKQLDELKKAVSVIPQSGSSSRFTPPDESRQHARHARSSSEILFTSSSQPESNAVSDTEEDPPRVAPPMVRKKSGEIVRSSLKPPHRRRPASMPSTPTYPKVVHFDQHLEHVRHFNHTEKPTAVSATSSPVEQIDYGHSGYPFPGEEEFEWEIVLPNFPADTPERRSSPVRLERVYLSTDKQSLMGSVAVANIAFQKSVVVRFTLDYWRTVSEVTAEFSTDVRRKQKEDGMDRFTFCIGLSDQVNLHKKTLFFCIRYNVGGQEFWDNNKSMNFHVDFKKKLLNNQSNGFLPHISALPRSRSAVNLSTRRPENEEFRSTISFSTESREKKTEVRRPSEDEGTALPVRKIASSNAFSNRYDFGASLTAAMQQPKQEKKKKQQGGDGKNAAAKPVKQRQAEGVVRNGAVPQPGAPQSANNRVADEKQSSGDLVSFMNASRKPPMQSLSYRELLDNYCFFGSERTSPDGSYTDLTSLRDQPKIPTHSLPSYTLVSPRSPSSGGAGLEMGSPTLRWSPSGGTSPPSLINSQHSSGSSTPVSILPPYNYQRRRHGGSVGGFSLETTAAATAIRG